MVGSISHELRTPLNGMINFLKSVLQLPEISDDVKNEYLIPSLDCS